MKHPWFVFSFSLALNAALVTAFVLRPALAPARVRETFHLGGGAAEARSAPKAEVPSRRAAAPQKLWPLLATEDLPALIARLRGAGFPPEVIREIVNAEVDARYRPRIRAYSEADPNAPFWKALPTTFSMNSVRLEEYQQLLRERSRVMRELLADPALAGDDSTAEQRRRFGDLPREKIDALQRIEDDYTDMMSAVRASANGILLAEDRAKLALLTREKRADLAGVLSAAELADYEMRSSPLTALLRDMVGEFRATEAEYRAIYDLHKTMNEKFPYIGGVGLGNNYNDRRQVQQELDSQLRAQIGEARYNDYVRETSDDFQQLRRLTQKENLPADTAVRAFDVRNSVSQESLRIIGDSTLSVDQKRTALATLAQATRGQLLSLLGGAGPAYVKIVDNQWLSTVERGNAVTFDGGPNRSIGNNDVVISLGSGPNFRGLGQPSPPRN
jgi:hypothetical protein